MSSVCGGTTPPAGPFSSFFSTSSCAHRALHSFPTRRSSDLGGGARTRSHSLERCRDAGGAEQGRHRVHAVRDRKSTRLNSSHRCISYAVFWLKKKRARSVRDQDTEEGLPNYDVALAIADRWI